MYPHLFQHYQPLKGKDWLKTISKEDLQVFTQIGFQASDYGRKGGQALAQKKGHAYMGNNILDTQ